MTDIMQRPAPGPDLTLSYGELPDQVIDLRIPPGIPAPLVVLVHGGFWRPERDRTYIAPMAHALAAAGYVVAVPEYRRAGMCEEGWTGTFNDVAAALDQVGKLAEPHGADLSRTTWVGHSAGGHLVLWAAARPFLPADCAWHGSCEATQIVSLAGCNSLRLGAEWNLGDGAAKNLMGGTPDEVPDRYTLADPAALTPTPLPVTLVHGSSDTRVPLAMSQAYQAGRLVEVPGADHLDLVDPLSGAWPHVLAAIRVP
ncbi:MULTISPECIES: alpha/beta hydrolase family protein [unclassified Streptomyces]|uniref:alpha/beta hydrolase family protein n=1 Tax=unclassified Streptomyces TaxID=2593676 RepID=UPI003D8DBE8C